MIFLLWPSIGIEKEGGSGGVPVSQTFMRFSLFNPRAKVTKNRKSHKENISFLY